MSKQILQIGQSYTFSQYFQLSVPIEEILQELNYSYTTERLTLPTLNTLPTTFIELKRVIERNFKLTSLISEDARKQALIAPILFEVCDFYQTKLNIEYPINAGEQLKGTLDYYIKNSKELLIVEAKNANLTRGFTQLAVELIALDKLNDLGNTVLYGAVTIGNIWKFGFLNRLEKVVFEDINLYIIPDRLEEVFKILLGILARE